MIYRVGDNEITTYDNKSLKTTAKSGSQEKFSLEQYSEGQIPEDKEKDRDEKKDAQKTGKSMPVRTESGGVKLELSAAGISGKGGGNRAQRSAESESGKAFLESVGRVGYGGNVTAAGGRNRARAAFGGSAGEGTAGKGSKNPGMSGVPRYEPDGQPAYRRWKQDAGAQFHLAHLL